MSKKKKKNRKGSKIENRVAFIIIGAVIALCSMFPVASSLFGQTGYITEITSNERFGGRKDEPGQPNAYEWHIGYIFRTKSGQYETGSVTVKGDAISSKSGLRAGSPVRYLAFAPRINNPGRGGFDGNMILYVFLIGLGVVFIVLGAREGKPSKKQLAKGDKKNVL